MDIETIRQLSTQHYPSEISRMTGIPRSTLHDIIKRENINTKKWWQTKQEKLLPQIRGMTDKTKKEISQQLNISPKTLTRIITRNNLPIQKGITETTRQRRRESTLERHRQKIIEQIRRR